MTMVVTPRRFDKVLTHRTSNIRRTVDVGSDSCFERDDNDDDDNNKKKGRHGGVADAPGPLSPFSPSPTSGGTSPTQQASYQIGNRQHKSRRRNKRTTDSAAWQTAKRTMTIALFLLATLGCSLWLIQQPNNTDIISNSAITRRTSEGPRFEQYSLDAPTFCNQTLDENEVEFTLVTQVSADRIWMMEHHCQRWQLANQTFYPISIAVLTNETTDELRHQLQVMGCDLDIVTVQTLDANLYHADDYPINTLRNLALRGVKTSHVVYIDIDFWINRDLSLILQFPEVIGQLASDPKAALVIPAFQLQRQCHEWRVRLFVLMEYVGYLRCASTLDSNSV